MPWETRNGKGRYYTRTNRESGRLVREYLGAGAYGEYWAAVDAQAQFERAERDAALFTEIDELVELDKLVAASAANVETAAHEALVVAGYKRHERGEWRKTRAQA